MNRIVNDQTNAYADSLAGISTQKQINQLNNSVTELATVVAEMSAYLKSLEGYQDQIEDHIDTELEKLDERIGSLRAPVGILKEQLNKKDREFRFLKVAITILTLTVGVLIWLVK